MSEFEDRINSILGDPAQMEKITQMAKSLMGGDDSPRNTPDMSLPGLDPAMLGRLSRLMNDSSTQSGGHQALLLAMKPYLSEKRKVKMDKALQLARFARIARIALNEMGGDSDG